MNSEAGIYLHLPFCSSVCPYCDFAVVSRGPDQRERFLNSLVEEIGGCSGSAWPAFVDSDREPRFDTIFFGGGTPSLLHPERIHALLAQLEQSLDLVSDPWIALEANPEDVTAQRLSGWKQLGVSYLSLGVQSFDPHGLEFLGRRHTSGQARRSIEMAREAGLPTVSIDLIYSLPGQTRESWRSDLSRALESEPDHISCYQLTIEPGTTFGFRKRRGRLNELGPAQQADLFFDTHATLESAGYAAYEVSNFASAPRHRSLHNQKYWNHQPYLGLGPSAHSFAGRSRWWNHRHLGRYLAAIDGQRRPIADSETLEPWQICLEAMALGLRTPRGVTLQDLPGDRGAAIWHRNQDVLGRWIDSGLIEAAPFTIRPTLEGMALADTLCRQLDLALD